MQERKTIWIDFDNSPHVPFFRPIIKELEKKGYMVSLSARDCFQVCGLADLYKLYYYKIGKHYGKNLALKIFGTILRSFQLIPFALRSKPVLALSHGSRSQLITAALLKIETILIYDYEYTSDLRLIRPDWTMAPDILPVDVKAIHKKGTLRYPGIKENVYVSDFEPDKSILSTLNLNLKEINITIRPPATEAHYHNPESERIFDTLISHLGRRPDVRMIILPRNEIKQTEYIKNKWSNLIEQGKITIPDHVVNGLDLMWFSDLVISGGGTMNREAAALGIPVYTIFRGKLGMVDKYLSEAARLFIIEKESDVFFKNFHRKKKNK